MCIYKKAVLAILAGGLIVSGMTGCLKSEKKDVPTDKTEAAKAEAASESEDVKSDADDTNKKLTKEELDAKLNEAIRNLEILGNGAKDYFAAHAEAADKSDLYPKTDRAVYIPSKPGKAVPDASEFRAEPWKSLNFKFNEASSLRYGYISDGKKFMAVAQLPSSEDGKCLMTAGMIGLPSGLISKVKVVASEGDCFAPAIKTDNEQIPENSMIGRYAENSKNMEGTENLRAIQNGATAYYQNERCSDAKCMTIESNVYPKAVKAVYLPEKDISAGERVSIAPSEYQTEPWKSMWFELHRPVLFRYGYISSEDRKRFAAVAQRRISDEKCVTYRIVGKDGNVTPPTLVSEGAECLPAVLDEAK